MEHYHIAFCLYEAAIYITATGQQQLLRYMYRDRYMYNSELLSNSCMFLLCKAPYFLISSCLAMWYLHARRTAMTLYLPSSSSISPSTCGWGSSSHLRHAKSTLRLSTMPASLHWPCTALSWPASLWSPSASCSPFSPRPATGCWQAASSLP